MQSLGQEASRLLNGMAERPDAKTLYKIQHWYESIRIPENLYVGAVEFDDANYARHVMYRDEHLEILMICWKPQQMTPVHDHPDHGCLVRVLAGELQETLFNLGLDYSASHAEDPANDAEENPTSKAAYFKHGYPDGTLRAVKKRTIGPGAVSFLEGDKGVHRIHNATTNQPALSLHMYAPPLYKPSPMKERRELESA